MTHIEHPDIEHMNRTGYTREQWRELHRESEQTDDHDRSEWDDDRG